MGGNPLCGDEELFKSSLKSKGGSFGEEPGSFGLPEILGESSATGEKKFGLFTQN